MLHVIAVPATDSNAALATASNDAHNGIKSTCEFVLTACRNMPVCSECGHLLQPTFMSMSSSQVVIMAGAVHAGKPKGVNAADLSKLWRIDLKAAERTLEVTSQNSKHADDPQLSRNCATNDRMLHHKRITEHFFMDMFFATKKVGRTTRGHAKKENRQSKLLSCS